MAIRDTIIKELELRLGGQMVDVELDPEHYNLAINKALEKFRQRSENAVEESFVELPIVADQSLYTLPDQIIEVRDIYRRATGTITQGGNDIEPFGAQFLNTYLLTGGATGGLATFDFLAQHRETLGRLFGAETLFTWNHVTHKLLLHRKIKADDVVFLHVYNYRPEDELLSDMYAKPWLKDYAFAQCKFMLGEARSKFNTIAGPQGGTTLNGDALKAEAAAEIEKLDQDLTLYVDGSQGLGFVIG